MEVGVQVTDERVRLIKEGKSKDDEVRIPVPIDSHSSISWTNQIKITPRENPKKKNSTC